MREESRNSKKVASRPTTGRSHAAGGQGNNRPQSNQQGLRVDESGNVLACDRYNRMGCDTKSCNFSHVCNKCNDPTHRAPDCKNVRMFSS